MIRRLALLLGLSTLGAPAALAADYQLDPSHSRVAFKVRHMMVSWVNGSFGTVEGTVSWDPAKPEATRVEATIGAASIDTAEPKRDEHLRSPDFFDVARFPELRFVSKRVENATPNAFDLVGDLSMHGVTREVTLHVSEITPEIRDPWGNFRVGGTASAVLDRQDFGLNWNKQMDQGGAVVGDEVKISIDVELVRPAK